MLNGSNTKLSKTQTIEVRTGLAKLLARENLTVVHSAAADTARFNVRTRVLTCPLWDKTSDHVYSLFLGHETSHALNTPASAIDDIQKAWPNPADYNKGFSICNILEDMRIDRMIQKTYPGLRRDYSIGYAELFNSGFFGKTDQERLNNLSLLDRINIHGKVGVRAGIKFTPEEQKVVDRALSTQTWSEVLTMAKEMFETAGQSFVPPAESGEGDESGDDSGDATAQDDKKSGKQGNGKAKSEKKDGKAEKSNDKKKSAKADGDKSESKDSNGSGDSSDESGDDENDQQGSGSGDDSENESENESGAGSGDSEGDDSGDDSSAGDSESGEGDDSESADGNGSGDAEGEQKSPAKQDPNAKAKGQNSKGGQTGAPQAAEALGATQDKFDKNAAASTTVSQGSYGDRSLLYTEPNMAQYDSLTEAKVPAQIPELAETLAAARSHFATLKGDAQVMAVTFECHKAAAADQRAQESKTGVLNVDKLCTYRWNDDVFVRNMVTPDGKSHGLVMFLDLSSSMVGAISTSANINGKQVVVPGGIFDQIVTLVTFCRLVKIQYQVYGFTSSGMSGRQDSTDKVQDIDGLTRMRHAPGAHQVLLFDSKDTPQQHMSRIDVMTMMWANMSGALNANDYYAKNPIALYYEKNTTATATPVWLSMGGTPLIEVACGAVKIVKAMQARGVQIVRTVFVTDGEASDMNYAGYIGNVAINDTKNRITIRATDVDMTSGGNPNLAMVLERLRLLTGTQVFNYYLMNRSNYRSHVRSVRVDAQATAAKRIKLAASDRYNVTENHHGFDVFVAMLFEDTTWDEERAERALAGLTGKKLKSAMLKQDQNKASNRPLMVSLGKSFAEAMRNN